MSPTLRKRWRTLGVFPGAFDWAFAARVWTAGENDTKRALSDLLRVSLLEWDKETGRYRMPNLAHDCAWARMTEGERNAAEALRNDIICFCPGPRATCQSPASQTHC